MVTFDEYVMVRGPRLVRLARLLIRDRHLAEDLVQEVLAKAFVRWAKISALDDPDVYVRRMLINQHASYRRKRSSGEIVTAAWDGPGASTDANGRSAERDAMWRLILDLPPKQRAVVALRFYEDLDDTAIAEVLGCSAVTVRTQRMRALKTLRRRMTARSAETVTAKEHE